MWLKTPPAQAGCCCYSQRPCHFGPLVPCPDCSFHGYLIYFPLSCLTLLLIPLKDLGNLWLSHPTITSELVHSVYPGPICPPLVCSRWLCTKQSIWLSFPLDYSVSSFLSSILHLIYSWSIYCWGDVHNEYPWAFIKLGFEQFLFPLLVLDVCWIWSLAYVKLTFCQHLPHTNTSLSLLNMLV